MQTRHASGPCVLDLVPLLDVSNRRFQEKLTHILGPSHSVSVLIRMRLNYTFGVASLVDSLSALMDLNGPRSVSEEMVKIAICSKVNRVYKSNYSPPSSTRTPVPPSFGFATTPSPFVCFLYVDT